MDSKRIQNLAWVSWLLAASALASVAPPTTTAPIQKKVQIFKNALADCKEKGHLRDSRVAGRRFNMTMIACEGPAARAVYEAFGPLMRPELREKQEQKTLLADGRKGTARYFGYVPNYGVAMQKPPSQCLEVKGKGKANQYFCEIMLDIDPLYR